jgi:hypothetical protein
MDSSKTIVKPEVLLLEDIFSMVEAGILRIPNFQRPFVWNDSMMLTLIDSILEGYPIGSLLFWRPVYREPFRSTDFIGPFEISIAKDRDISYVIDGYQRLTTLFVVLNNSRRKGRQIDPKFTIYWDLVERRLEQQRKSDPPGSFVPLNLLWNTNDLIRESERVRREFPEQAEIYVNDLQSIYSKLRSYKLATITMDGGDLDSAVAIFARLNSTGRKVSEVQMLNALTKTDLDSKFSEIRESIRPYFFDDLEDRHLMRSLYLSNGSDMYKMKPAEFSKKFGGQLDRISTASKSGLALASEFLWNRCGVPGIQWLPYAMQIIVIGEFFRRCLNPTEFQLARLEKWFWATSYQSWFGGANSTKVRSAIDDIVRLAVDSEIEFASIDFQSPSDPFPKDFQANSARVRTFFLFYLSMNPQPLALSGEILDSKHLLATYGRKAINPLTKKINTRFISNLFICPPTAPGVMVANVLNSDHAILKSHGISEMGLSHLVRGEYAEFEQLRVLYLQESENAFIKIKGLQPTKDPYPKHFEEDSDLNED